MDLSLSDAQQATDGFEYYIDEKSSKEWRNKIKEKVRQFSLAIQKQYGYAVVLRKQVTANWHDVYWCDVREAKQSWCFIVSDKVCEVKIHREVV